MSASNASTKNVYAYFVLKPPGAEACKLHCTIAFRHDCTPETYDALLQELHTLAPQFQTSIVRVGDLKWLDGPNGEPNHTKTYLLQLCSFDQRPDVLLYSKLQKLNADFSWRRALDKQYDYTMHVSVGKEDVAQANEFVIRSNPFFLMEGPYLKDMDSKEIVDLRPTSS